MKITIEIICPACHSANIVRNGKKRNGPQNYLCKNCARQFISDHEKTYRGALWFIPELIKMMLVRGSGIRDICYTLGVSMWKVLKTLESCAYEIKPKQKHYDRLEVDELWTYVGSKKSKQWLIYAYHRGSGEIVAYV